jgi:L-galactose dehydrogenase
MVSAAGLGSGGYSKLGLGSGKSEENAVAVVKAALDIGVTFFDTAIAYGTEEVMGRALGSDRDRAVICSKAPIFTQGGAPAFAGTPATAAEYARAVESSLARLRTDRIEIYLLHGIPADRYERARDTLVPVLERLKAEGKIGHIGLSERFMTEPRHDMLEVACTDTCWDVVMLGYNVLNPSAAHRILPELAARNVGVLGTFAVRKALASPQAAALVVADLVARGEVDGAAVDLADPLGFLMAEGGADSLTDAAYRYCRHTPGVDVVLTGTGSVSHLHQNVRSICAPPLHPAAVARARAIFADAVSVTGD